MTSTHDWTHWRAHFERQATRPLPPAPAPGDDLGVPVAWIPALVRSLARFQAGETSEGRLAHQIGRCHWAHIDEDYRASLRLFVKEEARHARILGGLVRALGGAALVDHEHWSKRLFVGARRAAGVRGKLLVAFGAEVAGLGFYGAMAAALPDGALRRALAELCDDERAHLEFHAELWRAQAPGPGARAAVRAAAVAVAASASALVLVDHAATFRAVGLPPAAVAARYAMLLAGLDGLLAGDGRAGDVTRRASA